MRAGILVVVERTYLRNPITTNTGHCVPRARVSYLWAMLMPQPALRKRRRMYTQSEIGRALGVSRNTVGRMEKDVSTVSLTTLSRYLALIGWRIRIGPKVRER